VLRHAAVSAQERTVGVGPDDGDGFVLFERKRGEVVLIFQERDRLARGIQRQLAMLITADDSIRFIGIDIRIIEKSHPEFPIEHRRNQIIQL
jgi:hypothetical protein